MREQDRRDYIQTLTSYLHRLALQQGEVKRRSTKEGLALESIKGPQAAEGSLAQKLNRETCRSSN